MTHAQKVYKLILGLFGGAFCGYCLILISFNHCQIAPRGIFSIFYPYIAKEELPPLNNENRVLVVISEIDMKPEERVIEESMIKRVKYPEHLLPRYAPLDITDVLGKLPTDPIYEGEIVSLQRLVDRDEYRDILKRHSIGGKFIWLEVPTDTEGKNPIVEDDRVDLTAVYSASGHGGTVEYRATTIAYGVYVIKKEKNKVAIGVNESIYALFHHLRRSWDCSFHLLLWGNHYEPTKKRSGVTMRFTKIQSAQEIK